MARVRVIFDCNVFMQALLSGGGPSFQCVKLVQERRIILLVSLEVLAEARDVLMRPFVVAKNPEVTPERVEAFLMKVAYLADVVRHVPHVQTFSRDPKDACYLDLAIAGEADYIVTRDKDLLELPSEHSADARQFRQLSRNQVRIVDPALFLNEIERRP
jgi:putative PIN family toxin of toxin-antitoxin system